MAASSSPFAYSRDDFLLEYPALRDLVIKEVLPKYPELPAPFVEYMGKMIDHNVPGGKLNRGITVVHSLAALKGDSLTPEETSRAAAVGWCIEWLQAFFLVADDVMDDSLTRRGQPCWFRVDGVGLIAINDAFLLKSHIHFILKKACGADKALFASLLELFLEVTWRTELGQGLDLTSFDESTARRGDFSNYTAERYFAIVKYKTAFYTYWLPVASALILAGVNSDEAMEAAQHVCEEMGMFFQIQDDFLDCFGDPEVIGKVGTDIEEGKCTWLAVQALKACNEEQREVFASNVGRREAEHVARVKDLYRELKLPEMFAKLEDDTDAKMKGLIDECERRTSGGVPALLFERLWAKTHKRSK
jgi:farnesyl diphosphate synthase